MKMICTVVSVIHNKLLINDKIVLQRVIKKEANYGTCV